MTSLSLCYSSVMTDTVVYVHVFVRMFVGVVFESYVTEVSDL